MTLLYSERVDSEERTQLLQWGISLLLVVVMHFSVALWLFSREAAFEAPKPPPPPAAYIDLAPIEVPKVGTPPVAPVPANPAPLPPPAPSTPQVKETPPAVKPPPPVPDVPKIAVPPPKTASVKAPPPKPPKPQVQPQPQPQPAPDTGPPSLTGSQPIVRLSPVAAWQASVIAQITSLKKWPPEAVQMKLTGTAILFIRVDRMGNILEYRLLGSSGYRLLDKATLDMARRAVRLAPLPAQIQGEDYGFNLSIDWF